MVGGDKRGKNVAAASGPEKPSSYYLIVTSAFSLTRFAPRFSFIAQTSLKWTQPETRMPLPY